MQNRYLLYIDILGFTNYVNNDTMQVHRIYKIIEDLHAHDHYAFKVIVFSDTILIYNFLEPLTKYDQEYCVMYLIEFAKNLLYEFSGKNLFFRALLVQGEFEHITSGRFEKYFGKALIDAHYKEKCIKCCGLFIDKRIQKHNVIFPVENHDQDVYFVYMNQSLDDFYHGKLGKWPVDQKLMEQTDSQWHLAQDVYFLRDVYNHMQTHKKEDVRVKMKATWDYYHKRYPLLLNDLVTNKFSLTVLSTGFNWSPAESRITEGFRGFSENIPSLEELRQIIEEARQKGTIAAKAEFKKIYGDYKPGEKFNSPCGGGRIVLDISKRSPLARRLKEASTKLNDFAFHPSIRRSSEGSILRIRGMHTRQERDIDVAASKAALDVLQKRLGVIGYVEEYLD